MDATDTTQDEALVVTLWGLLLKFHHDIVDLSCSVGRILSNDFRMVKCIFILDTLVTVVLVVTTMRKERIMPSAIS